jgi:hypothetical protein
MSSKTKSSNGQTDTRTPFQKFDELAHRLFPPVKAVSKPAKSKRKKSRN